MSDRTGIGLVELAALEVLDELGARPDGSHVKCARAVQTLAEGREISRRYGYDALCTLARPWLLHVPLVDFHGNLGSADEHDRPANPRYTEARLSRAGALALEAERGSRPPLPIGLINGDMYQDGSAPPFAPRRVVSALVALLDDRQMPDDDLVERIGLPAFPTGCGVKCDAAALAAGAATELVLSAHLDVAHGDRGPSIVVSHLPFGVGPAEVSQALANRVDSRFESLRDRRPEQFERLTLPLRDIRDESRDNLSRLVCDLRADADVDDCKRRLAETWGVTTRRVVQLRAPLSRVLRNLIGEDAASQRLAFVALLDAGPV